MDAHPLHRFAVPLKVNCPEGAREATLGCPQWRRQEGELIPACCNWERGHCLPLDMACPQQLSPSRVSCKYFRTAVLPAEKELYAEIIRQNRKDGDGNGLPRMV